jgi:hypothetical protein
VHRASDEGGGGEGEERSEEGKCDARRHA